MKNKLAALMLGVASLIAGCATPYGEMGFAGGYESNWLAPDILSVEVSGNGFTSDRTVREHAMLQAAQRAQQAGYRYFVIVSNENHGGMDTYYSPPTATTTTSATVYGNSIYANSTTNTSGGIQQVYKPARGLVVRMFRDAPPGFVAGQFFEVNQIIAELGPRYIRR